MKRIFFLLLLALFSLGMRATTVNDPTAVTDLVQRVCGTDAVSHFTFILNDEFNEGAEAFQLGYAGGKVTVTANTMSALTCGLNWYLNHEAHVNIAWNNLRQDLTSFPEPNDKEVHASDGPYRYYLNYCTFSYSMAFWDWDRWEKEIDWMALHGVNISLQIVGVDALWYKMLTDDYHFTHEQASAWIAGPAHQAWWLMDNLSGMGGPNPAEWYTRQATLGRNIVNRMVELGIEPAIPGFIGMVPESIAGNNPYTGTWTSGISCPVVINASETATFNSVAENYYKRLKEIFGYSPKYYANDVMHERRDATGGGQNYINACQNVRDAMNEYAKYGEGDDDKPTWIAQMWQENATQYRIDALDIDRTLLLDLSSERKSYTTVDHTGKGSGYGSHEYLFCMLHNYGGNIGMYGCMQKMLDEYKSHKQTGIANGTGGTLKGVGATPEGIETNPVLYDLLFELPWHNSDINAETWLNDYATARYGIVNTDAQRAWNRLRTTVYANTSSSQQGCREPVFCARPNLSGNNASKWAGASYHWDKYEIVEATYELLSLGSATNTTNYEYDVVDFARQALTDYAHTLQLDMAGSTPYNTNARFAAQSEGFLQLMRDIDAMLGTVEDFRLGRWVGAARRIAETEVPTMSAPTGFTSAADWLERNARLLLTTWYDANSADGLMEYANREYQGLITGYYLPRWEYYFQNLKSGGNGPNSANLYNKIEKAFVYGQTNDASQYTAVPYGTYTANQATGDPITTAQAMMQKYFGKLSNGRYYSPNVSHDFSSNHRIIVNLNGKNATEVLAALDGIFMTKTTGSSVASYTFDENGDGNFTETVYTDGSLPTLTGVRKCQVATSDGALITIIANFDENEVTDDPTWPAITAKDRDNNAASQYVSSIKVNNQTVYTKSSNLNLSDANDGPQIIIHSLDVPTVAPGQTVTVQWTGTGLNYTYLSAYLDKNANQQFEHTSEYTECLGYNGNKGGQNSVLNNNSFTFTIPEDIPYGVTCLRLRFDGAWMESSLANCSNSSITVPCLQSGSTATGTAVNPNHSTNRTTYDIHLRVVNETTPEEPEENNSAFDDTKLYTLKTTRGYMPKTPTNNIYSTNNRDDAGRFRITYVNGSYHLYNVDLGLYLAANAPSGSAYVQEPDGTFRIYPASDLNGSADKWIIHSDANDKWLMFDSSNQYLNNNGWKTVDDGDQWMIEEYVRTDWSVVVLSSVSSQTRTDQYAKQITINGVPVAGGQDGYSEHPGWHVVTDVVEVVQGEDFTLGWLTNSTAQNLGLAYTRATLYLDKNADYDFDDEDECLGTLGSFCSNESAMNNRTLSISTTGLPLNTETVLRLRFDGTWIHPANEDSSGYTNSAWFTPTASAHDFDTPSTATYAFLPEVGATRVVYDIHIKVVEPEPAKWTAIEWHEGVTSNDKFVNTLTVGDTQVYNNESSTAPMVPYIVTNPVTVERGSDVTVAWTNTTNQLNTARLTAYLDWDSNDTFDHSSATKGQDDLLGILGNLNSGSNFDYLDNKSFTISIPEDAQLGETRLRLRLDPGDATLGWASHKELYTGYQVDWLIKKSDGSNYNGWYAYLPDEKTNCIVYDVPFVIVEATAPELTSFEHEGWTYTCTSEGTNLTLLNATGGTGELNIPATVENEGTTYNVVALDENFLTGNTDVTKVVLPASIHDLDEEAKIYLKQHCTVSDGEMTLDSQTFTTRKCQLSTKPLSGNCWNLTVKLHQDDATLNSWGTHLLCAAENPSSTSFPFLFYQNATGKNDGKLQLSVYNNHEENKHFFDFSLCGHSATIEFKYRNGELNVKVIRDDGETDEMTITTYYLDKAKTRSQPLSISNVTWLSTAKGTLDNGIDDISYNFVDDDRDDYAVPFEGCTNLAEIVVADDNEEYSSVDGALFDKHQYMLLRMPTVASARVTAPQSLTMIVPGAFDVSQSLLRMTLTQYLLVDGVQHENTSIALTDTSDGETALMEQTDATFAEVTLDRKPSVTNWTPVVLPFDIEGDEISENFSDVYEFGSVTSTGDNLTLHFTKLAENAPMQAGTPYLVLATDATAQNGMVFENKTLNQKPLTKKLSDDNYTVNVVSLYDRKEIEGNNIFYFASNKLYYAERKVTIKGFRAYLEVAAKAQNASVRTFAMQWDEDALATDVDGMSVTLTPAEMYNLHGQRVTRANGIVIVDGKKVVVTR